jgi:tetratricopeptide (TPR) repeat protein
LAQQRVFTFLGGAFIRDYRYHEARDYWQKALAISLELENEYGTANLYNNLGDALRELGEFAAAEDAFEQAMIRYKVAPQRRLYHERVRRMGAVVRRAATMSKRSAGARGD